MTYTIQFSKYALRVVFLLLFLLLFGATVFSLIKPSSIQAACYCVDPVGDSCRCTLSVMGARAINPSAASFCFNVAGDPTTPAGGYGEEICCDTDYEANTYWSIINPVCGSATETIPYCSWRYSEEGHQHNDITCWGTQWAEGGNIPPSTFGTLEPWTLPGPVQFNNFSAGPPTNIHTCESNIFCCGSKHQNGTSFCSSDGVPAATPCEPQNTEIVPPDWCGLFLEGAISCNETGGEFHTFRPYPKSPCDPVAHELAPFCGNTLNLTDGFGIEKHWTFTPPDSFAWTYWYSSDTADPGCVTDDEGNISCPIPEGECVPSSNDGYEICTFFIGGRKVEFFIFLEGAFLPIMGNTELVVHSGPPLPANTDTLTDAQKVNEYVSWYLNGITNNPTEYGIPGCLPYGTACDNPNDCCTGHCALGFLGYTCSLPPSIISVPSDPDDIGVYQEYVEKVVNYSGPLRKLLPHRIQRDIASSEVEDAYGSVNEGANIRHNQLAGCVFNLLNNPLDWGKVVECYHNSGASESQVRLADTSSSFMEDRDEDRLPPREEDFDSAVDWVFAFRVWRGQICLLLPLPPGIFGDEIQLGFCFNNPFALDAYSELFFHIPLSSTEDRIGLVDVVGAGFRPMPISNNPNEGHRIIDSNVMDLFDDSRTPFSRLYFSHMQETSELADSLQKTYSAKNEPLVTAVTNVQPPLWCDVSEVRSNPGDNLFPEPMRGVIEYSSEVDCRFVAYDPDDPNPTGALCILAGASCVDPADIVGETCCVNYGSMDCDSSLGEFCGGDCRSNTWDIGVFLPPYDCGGFDPADPDFSCQVGCLTCESASWSDNCPPGFQCARNDSCSPDDDATLPVERCDTAVMISLETETKTPKADEVWSRLVAGEKGVFKKIFPKIELGSPIEAIWDIPASSPVTIWSPFLDSVGNPAAGRDIPELYFSHIGGIHQYFLKCVQTALRPKGFGEPCLSGSPGTGGMFYCACNPPIDYTFCMEQHPDINLAIRGYEQISGNLNYIDDFHPAGSPLLDPNAPQLNTLLEGEARPNTTTLYQVNNWDWNNNTRGGPIERPIDLPGHLNFATLVGFATFAGQGVYVPVSGYDIGGGYEVSVLYATSSSIALKYTGEDDMAYGYGLHLENFDVNQEILDEYNRLNAEGRYELPALCAGKRIGSARDFEIRVAIRDTGSFMDPRWVNDWWPNDNIAVEDNCEIRRMEPTRDCIMPPPGTPGSPGSPSSCALGTGFCSVSNLQSTFGSEADNASRICQRESGSSPTALNDDCLWCSDGIDNDGDGLLDYNDPDCDEAPPGYAVGLFQINIHPLTGRCPGAWTVDPTKPDEWCEVANQSILDNCVSELENPDYNIQRAYQIGGCTSSGCNWCPWLAAWPQYCNLADCP